MLFDCSQRWRAYCNHVRTGGMLTTHSPMSESNTTSIVYTTSATTSSTTTGTAGPTNKGNQNNLVLTTCELQATNIKNLPIWQDSIGHTHHLYLRTILHRTIIISLLRARFNSSRGSPK